jgi:hypothetical protein
MTDMHSLYASKGASRENLSSREADVSASCDCSELERFKENLAKPGWLSRRLRQGCPSLWRSGG